MLGWGGGGGAGTNNRVLLLSYQLCLKLKAHEFAILTVHLFQAIIKMLLFPPFLLVQFGHQTIIFTKEHTNLDKNHTELNTHPPKEKKRSQDVKDSNSHNNYFSNLFE